MCGRYYLNEDTLQFLSQICDEEVEANTKMTPGMNIPIVMLQDHQWICIKKKWGYSLNSSLVINARCETVMEKKLFSQDIMLRRCLIPCSGFYEWDALKHSIAFENEKGMMWLAGIYNEYDEVCILTTCANDVMKPVHPRNPLMITENDKMQWLSESFKKLLTKENNDLKIVSGNIQQSLF